jgi:Domain of unknown function (DUF5655)
MARLKRLWTCPACGERFVSPQLSHSCGRYSYDALFAKSEPHVRRIFDKLATIARACGPVRIYPQKTRAIMQVRIRFAGCRPMKKQLVAHFLLPHGTTSPRFSEVLDNASPHYIAAYVPLQSEAEVDAEIRRWMKRAYRFGCQEHLRCL